MNTYKTANNFDLIRLLDKFELLTYESRKHLIRELNLRKIKVDENKINSLRAYLENEDKDLSSFIHLDKMGFSLIKHGEKSFEIKRSNKAKNGDLFAGIIGFLIICISLLIFTQLYISYKQDEFKLNLSQVSLFIVFVILMRYGLLVVVNAYNRLINYSKFSFLIKDYKVTLNKIVYGKFLKIEKPVHLLELEKGKKEVLLKLDEVEVFKIANANLKDIKTIEAIYNNSIKL